MGEARRFDPRDRRRDGRKSLDVPRDTRKPAPPKLPMTRSKVELQLNKKIQVWFGKQKIGKTVTASQVSGGALFLAFEPGHDHVEVFKIDVNTWAEFLAAISALEAAGGEVPYGTVVIDTVGMAFIRCQEHVLGQMHIQHESDAAYGKGTAMVEREFRQAITRLCHLGFGVIMLAHVGERKRTDASTRKEYTELVIDLPKIAERVVPPLADLILYFTLEWNEVRQRYDRVIKTRPTEFYEAGVRYPPGAGQLPETIPMSYAKLERAWNECVGVDAQVPAPNPATTSAPAQPAAEPPAAEKKAEPPSEEAQLAADVKALKRELTQLIGKEAARAAWLERVEPGPPGWLRERARAEIKAARMRLEKEAAATAAKPPAGATASAPPPVCAACTDSGLVTCERCKGYCHVRCTYCEGPDAGRLFDGRCPKCSGDERVTCPECKGGGDRPCKACTPPPAQGELPTTERQPGADG